MNYLGAYSDGQEEEIWVVMEYLRGGTLNQAAKAHRFNDNHVAYVANSILTALDYLHDRKYAHRDLKSQNVMMDVRGIIKLSTPSSLFLARAPSLSLSSSLDCLITSPYVPVDFGLCAEFENGPRLSMVGTPYWVPPEMIRDEPHSFPTVRRISPSPPLLMPCRICTVWESVCWSC